MAGRWRGDGGAMAIAMAITCRNRVRSESGSGSRSLRPLAWPNRPRAGQTRRTRPTRARIKRTDGLTMIENWSREWRIGNQPNTTTAGGFAARTTPTGGEADGNTGGETTARTTAETTGEMAAEMTAVMTPEMTGGTTGEMTEEKRGKAVAEVAGDEIADDETAGDEIVSDEAAGDEVADDEVADDEAADDEAPSDEAASDETAGDDTGNRARQFPRHVPCFLRQRMPALATAAAIATAEAPTRVSKDGLEAGIRAGYRPLLLPSIGARDASLSQYPPKDAGSWIAPLRRRCAAAPPPCHAKRPRGR